MIDDVLRARNGVHGDFSADAGQAQEFKHLMRASPNWEGLTDVQKEALEHIATKLARILVGNPNHADHWRDIQGYAKLVEQSLDLTDPPIESAIGVLLARANMLGGEDARQRNAAALDGRGGQGDPQE